jgi:hypothetical protein
MTVHPIQPQMLSYADPSVRGGRNRMIRGFMVLLAIALPVGVGAWRVSTVHARQQQLVAGLNSISARMAVETDSIWHRVIPARYRKYFDRVRMIDLSGCASNGLQLKLAAEAGSVRELNLSTQPVVDSELAELAPLKSLRVLRLEGGHITDASAPVLGGFENLQLLDVRDTGLTDVSVPFLCRLSALRDLRLEGTQITRAAVKRLRAALPDCAIDVP